MLGFDNLEVGDEFYYEYFVAEDYYDDNNSNYEILADTLVLEVCNIIDGNRYVISERITENSAMNSSSDTYYYEADSVFTSFWILRNDSFFLEKKSHETFRSHLFFNSKPTLPLQNFNGMQTELFGWKFVANASEFPPDYFIENGIIGNNNYPHINVVVNEEGTFADGPGFLYFYNEEDGIVRSATWSAWTGMGAGWERIKN